MSSPGTGSLVRVPPGTGATRTSYTRGRFVHDRGSVAARATFARKVTSDRTSKPELEGISEASAVARKGIDHVEADPYHLGQRISASFCAEPRSGGPTLMPKTLR